MLIRPLAFAILLALSPLPAVAASTITPAVEAEAFSTAQLMQATALDTVFAQFGQTVAETPKTQGIPGDAQFLRAWYDTALESFDPDTMQSGLSRMVDGKFSPDEMAEFATFYGSDFGRHVTEIERAVAILPAEAQMTARDEGVDLLADISSDSPRGKMLDRMMELVSADITRAMVGQSLRGMLLGMSMSQRRGDIEVPWSDIEAQLAQILPSMDAEIEGTQRALMAYAYRDLSDAELGTYVDFLATPAAQKFYAVASYSIGSIVTSAMNRFGESLARKLNQVNT